MEETKGTILIVDDEETIRGILSRKMESDGYHCEVAADGKEALWKVFMRDFDLVLMDIKMPGLSGIEALPQIVTSHPDTCVIMMTAVVDTETAVQAMKLGAYDYVTKPFDLDDLQIRMEKALERKKLILENRDQQLRLEQKIDQQARQIQEYYRNAVETLSREQISLDSSRAESNSKHAEGKPSESSGAIREFTKKLSQLFNKGAPELSDVNVDAASAQIRAAGKVPQVGTTAEKEENIVLYNGSVELSFSGYVNLQQVLQFYNTLRYVRQVDVVDVVGLVEKNVTIKLLLVTPTPLIKILKVLPGVAEVSDDPGDAENTTSSSQGEPSQSKRIMVRLGSENPVTSNSNL